MNYLIGVVALGVLCGGWVAVQLWIAKHSPGGAQFKPCCGACSDHCRKEESHEH